MFVLPPGGGGVLQHPEGLWLPFRETGAHLCEGERGTTHIFPEGKRQTRLIHQQLLCHSATPGGGQLRTANTHTRPQYTAVHIWCVMVSAEKQRRESHLPKDAVVPEPDTLHTHL